ncbi:hypothetical protein C8Q74DRAFT_1291039 [Fomes fomentarius]|nr:hypothetical protein C8Q74DRAFT_1291039 [Fomes fomentarius]
MRSSGAHFRSPIGGCIWRFGACSVDYLYANPGYAFGLLFICPLGDLVRRQTLICVLIFLVTSLTSSGSPSP